MALSYPLLWTDVSVDLVLYMAFVLYGNRFKWVEDILLLGWPTCEIQLT